MINTDLIGDIHGHASVLKSLLEKMGYVKRNGAFTHPERRIIFVGDYIDRGPQIPETLEIVRSMVEGGSAIALMGNHEYNAICFNMQDGNGQYLRPHNIKNFKQHAETMLQFQNRQSDYDDYIEWFKTLPLWYEDDHFRAVHACWDQQNINSLQSILNGNQLSGDNMVDAGSKGTELFSLLDETLKGKELSMPDGQFFYDKDGHKRQDIRIKWWLQPSTSTYRDLSIIPMDDKLPPTKVDTEEKYYYGEDQKPVFFGHYWLKGEPNLYRGNICCLDFSVAKGGFLAAYRYDGEEVLNDEKWVWV